MADNYVEIKIKASDEARPDIAALKAELDDLGHEVESARVDVDDDDAKAKLLALNAKLADLNKKLASPKITVAGAARAEAQIAAVSAGLHHLSDESGEEGDRGGESFMSRFGSWLKPSKFQLITAGVSSALAALPALGAIGGVGLVAGLGVGVLAQEPKVKKAFSSVMDGALKTVQQAAKPLMGPLLAALRQFGSFVKSIAPELHSLFAGVAPMLQPLLHGLEALVKGLLPGLSAIIKAAGPAIHAFASLLGGLGKSVGGMFAAMAPAVKASSVVLKAIGTVLNGLLPTIGKLAGALASSLGPVLLAFGKAIKALSPAIAEVGKILGSLAGAVLSSLGEALEAVAGLVKAIAPSFGILARVLGQVFHAMENSGVFGTLEDALEGLAGPLGKLIGGLVSGLAPVLGKIVEAVIKVASVITAGLVSAVLALLPGVTQLVNVLVQFLVSALTPLLPAVEQLALALVRILVSLTPLLPPLLKIVTLVIQLALKAISPLIPLITLLAELLSKVAGVVAVVVGWIAKIIAAGLEWITNFGKIKHSISDVFDWIKGHWPLLLAILSGPIGLATLFIVDHWNTIKHGAQDMVHDLVSFFESLPGKIMTALSRLASDLFTLGKDAILGLVHGAESLLGDVAHIGADIGHTLESAFKSVLHIGSPSKVMYDHGRNIALGLIGGMESMRGQVAAAAGRMGTAASLTGHPALAGASGSGAGGALTLDVRFAGSDSQIINALWPHLKLEVRTKGGGGPYSAQKAFGSTWPRGA